MVEFPSTGTLAVILGSVCAFLLHNERRLSRLEQSREDAAKDTQWLKNAVSAIHERLDDIFIGGERTKKRN